MRRGWTTRKTNNITKKSWKRILSLGSLVVPPSLFFDAVLFSLVLFSFLRCFSFLDVFELFWCPFRSDIDFRFLFKHLLSSHMKNRSFDDIFWCFQRETSELLESVLMSLDSRHLYGYTRSKTCLEESNIASKVWMIWCICFHSFCFSTNAFCSLRDFYHIHRLLSIFGVSLSVFIEGTYNSTWRVWKKCVLWKEKKPHTSRISH